ncbi:MAG TPA: STAS/SEC14 domain-containing protein [Acidimicrobiia bacterium]|nr:STAS/SEC14 domain-containing protein [Acidimicrobiia bacterium]
MIEILTDLPEGVIGAKASGTVTADDYESVLIPAVSKATEGDGKAKFLLIFGDEFEGYSADAAMDDAKLGAHHWSDFDKIALVSDHTVYRGLVKGFGFLMPGEVRVFPMSELDAATDWLAS